jgi:hypothetical protein
VYQAIVEVFTTFPHTAEYNQVRPPPWAKKLGRAGRGPDRDFVL